MPTYDPDTGKWDYEDKDNNKSHKDGFPKHQPPLVEEQLVHVIPDENKKGGDPTPWIHHDI